MNPAPARPLVVLTVLVLAAHVLLLKVAPPSRQAPGSGVSRSLVTRTISLESPSAPVIAQAAPAPAPAAVAPPRAEAPTRRAQADPPPRPAPAETVTVRTVEGAAPMVAAAQPTAAQRVSLAIPGPTRLTYQVDIQSRGQSVQGRGELTWRHDGESYEAALELKSPASPTHIQRSNGRITAQGLAPTRFSDRRRSEEATHFEREKGKVSFSSNRPDAPLVAGTQDRLSVVLQLAAMLAGDPAKFPVGSTISLPTATTREAELWLFIVESEEDLNLPGGRVRGLKLTRNPRREFDSKVELWLAPGMDYAPVRLRLTHPNGDTADQQWSSTDRP